MSPNSRRLSDIAIIVLAAIGAGALTFSKTGLATSFFCGSFPLCAASPVTLDVILERAALGLLLCIAAYALFVRAPLHHRQFRARNRLARKIETFKQNCLALMLPSPPHAAFTSLMEPDGFRHYFERETSAGRNRWQAFDSNLDQPQLDQIFSFLKELHDEITVLLNSIEIKHYAPLEIRKRLSVAMDAIQSASLLAAKKRAVTNILWEICAERDAILGIRQDLLHQSLRSIDWNYPLPFTRSWWRKSERAVPVSAYQVLL
jgi:hypothetical protein